MTIIEYKNTEFRLRTVWIDGEPWFVAKDVCQMLGIKNPRDAVSRLDDDEKGVAIADTPGGPQEMASVSESGLYSLIFQSAKAEAKVFRRWVTSEVLPALRREGVYRMMRVDAQRVREIETGIEGTKKKLAAQLGHLWKVQEVDGNVSLKSYLLAAGLTLPAKHCMMLGARCAYRCKVFGDPVGKIRQRRGRHDRTSAGHQRFGWHCVSTFPPHHIAVEVRGLGYEHAQPGEGALRGALAALMPSGHKLNPARPLVSLYTPTLGG